jgi:hypothetical protein
MIFIKCVGPDPHTNGAKSVSCRGCQDIWEIDNGDFAVIGIDITNSAGVLPSSVGCRRDERMAGIPHKTPGLTRRVMIHHSRIKTSTNDQRLFP